MPIGPRPEPPPVPRKETRKSPIRQPDPAGSVPQRPPKIPVYGTSLDNSSSYGNFIPTHDFNSNKLTRLKGPRPLSSPGKQLGSAVPYPTTENRFPPVPEQHSSILDDSLEAPIVGSITMPEPDSGSDSCLPASITTFDSYPSLSNLSESPTSISYREDPPESYSAPVPSLVPPPLMGKTQYNRPTKSIFQWGIPAELLPPMPVPVNAMSGLQVGSGGQYTMNLDLPQIPPMDPVRPKFSVEQLTVTDFQYVKDVWSISSLARWLYELIMGYDSHIAVDDAKQAITRLFLYRINGLTWNEASDLADSVVNSLIRQYFIAGGLDQLVLNTSGPEVSGVLSTLSGYDGCYSSSSHFGLVSTRCYASRCLKDPQVREASLRAYHDNVNHGGSISTDEMFFGTKAQSINRKETSASRISQTTTNIGGSIYRASDKDTTTLPMDNIPATNLLDAFVPLEMNWRKFWNLEESDIKEVDPVLVKLQFAIHELIMSEILYVRDLQIYLDVYGEIELMEGLSIMNNQKEFISRVFDRIRAVLKTNRKLLFRLLERQRSEGPYVGDVGDLLTEWALEKDTQEAYTKYATDYLWTDHHLRRELMHSSRLQKWMEERAKDHRLTGRPHSFFFHRILPRVARYHLLLSAILKYMKQIEGASDCSIVEQAIQACNLLTQRCDDCVAKQKLVLDVQNLKAHIVFKSSSVTADLKLGDKRRRLIRRGDMIRRGDLKMDWVDTHTLLLDNFLVLSKTREGMNGTAFYVTKAPIPLDLLVLESCEEEGVVKVSSKIAFTRQGPTEEPEPSSESDKYPVLYPLKLTHLGSGGQKYVLFVPTRPERSHWAQSIVQAKQSRAQLAYTRSAEPFRLQKISDQFAYPESETPQLPVPIPDTPLHRAVGSIDPDNIPIVTLRRKVNCIITVGSVYFVGTDDGIWIGTRCTKMEEDASDEISWSSVLPVSQKVIRLEVLETMNALFVLCGDHNLTWYPLDQIVCRGLGDKRKAIGVRLNKSRKVIDFVVAYHKGRVVLMYLQQGGILKVVEPIRSHGATSKKNLLKLGLVPATSCVDSFREVDRIQVAPDTSRITAFLKSIVLTSSKSFEWVTLDSKQLMRIPSGANNKEMQHWGRPIRLIKLDSSRILMCYESCYVIGDISGNVGIQPTTWFLEKCAECAYYAPYLILVAQGGEMLEIRYVDEFPGRLAQLITGKDIKLLIRDEEPIYIRIAHPWMPGRQLILQLIGNETVRDNESSWQSSSV